MRVRVFIENEAGSNLKHYYDEKALILLSVAEVSRPYPFPYGFVLGTRAADGCNVDCFVLTPERLRTGQTIECEVISLMEQFEDGKPDHNVLATLSRVESIDAGTRATLSEFVLGVFAHIPGKQISVGRFLGPTAAEAHVLAHLDDRERAL
jgi:inorganic pyrophosphatase